MASSVQSPKGTYDILPNESYRVQYVEATVREICERFGFKEVRTPVFEHTELFIRGVGETTDIVNKEMYTMTDKGGRSITLRPEGTAGTVRSFIQHGVLKETLPVRAYYIMSCFRYENPQSGRFRQHSQLGVEVFGAATADADAEIIFLGLTILAELGIKNTRTEINSIGCSECRVDYHKALTEYFSSHIENLCGTCKDRLERNPLRILDCKSQICQQIVAGAPKTTDYLCDNCSSHFENLKTQLDELGIEYIVNPRIVRGQDYYSKTVFELIHNSAGAAGTVCGGGRYDRLVEFLGGSPCSGIGFGMGIERILMVMKDEGIEIPLPTGPKIFFAYVGDEARAIVRKLTRQLQQSGVYALYDINERSLKAQLKYADRQNTEWLMVIGEGEVLQSKAKLRHMSSKAEKESELSLKSIIAATDNLECEI
ncbi:MAG: histidine--tRNA ligase [Oscillospiraceae bacterium]|nr:histidine--tRNA ligase [Oscillospiraceae bacterium]